MGIKTYFVNKMLHGWEKKDAERFAAYDTVVSKIFRRKCNRI